MGNLLNMSGGSLLNKGLPYDVEIEYLESTGTQYIDTGVKNYTNTICFFIDFQYTDLTGRALNGVGNSYYMGINNGRWEAHYQTYFGTCDFNRHTLEERFFYVSNRLKKSVYFDDSLVGTYNIVITDSLVNNILIYASGNKTSYFAASIEKIFSSSITVDDVLVRDFIPVVKDNVGYMYDKVSGTLFGNAGTGSFIVGPRVS